MTQGAIAVSDITAGNKTALNISASTVVKAANGRMASVSVLTAGSTVGSVHDAATVIGASASNLVAHIPNTVGVYPINFQLFNGLVIVPGTGQVVSVSYL